MDNKTKILLTLTISLLIIGSTYAVTETWEDGDYTANPTWTTFTGYSACSVQSSTKYAGTYALQCANGKGLQTILSVPTGISDNNAYLRYDGGGTQAAFNLGKVFPTDEIGIDFYGGTARYNINDSATGIPSGTISTNTWYKVRIKINKTTQKASFYLYDTSGNLLASQIDSSITSASSMDYNTMQLINGGGAGSSYYDNISTAIDTSGSINASFTYSAGQAINTDENITHSDWNFTDTTTINYCTYTTHSWDNNRTGHMGDTNNLTNYQFTSSGDYNVTLTATGTGCGTSTQSQIIHVGKTPTGIPCTITPPAQMLTRNTILTPDTETAGYTFTIKVNNTQDSNTVYNYQGDAYTLQRTDFYDNLTYQCRITNTDGNTTKPTTTYNTGLIDTKINYGYYDSITNGPTTNYMDLNFQGNGLTGTQYYASTNSLYLSNILTSGNDSKTLTYTATDPMGIYRTKTITGYTFDRYTIDQNLTMQPPQLLLIFDVNTAGMLSGSGTPTIQFPTGLFSQNFTNTFILISQSSLPEGVVNVNFNDKGAGYGTQQTYQYVNNRDTDVNDSITIINHQVPITNKIGIQVKGLGGLPIENAIVRVYDQNTQTGNGNLIDQLLTDNTGSTAYYTDNNRQQSLQVIAEGYDPNYTTLINTSEFIGTTQPIILKQSGFQIQNKYSIYAPTSTNITTIPTTIQLLITAIAPQQISVQIIRADGTTETKATTEWMYAYQTDITNQNQLPAEVKVSIWGQQQVDINYWYGIPTTVKPETNGTTGTALKTITDLWNTLQTNQSTKTPEQQTETNRAIVFIGLITTVILAGIGEATMQKGALTFFTVCIIMSFAVNAIFILPAALGVLFIFRKQIGNYLGDKVWIS